MTVPKHTNHDIRELAKAALIIDDEDCGSERHQNASDAFAKAVESRLTPKQAEALWERTTRERGTDDEVIDTALRRIKVKPLTREEVALARLSNELTRWYADPAQANIPEEAQGCAVEVQYNGVDLTEAQREWLRDYVHRWDAKVQEFRS